MSVNDATTSKRTRTRWPTAACVAALCLLSLALFAVTVRQRAPWFGHPDVNTITMSGSMTVGATGMAKNWYLEGACRLWFVMYWDPHSIETPTLESRRPYVSYPPGAALPIYVLAKVSGRPPAPPLTMAYNLANQYGIALSLAILVFLVVRQMGFSNAPAAVFAVLPIVLYLWLPSPFWEHQMGYFADQAVILPYVLYILLEAARESIDSAKGKRVLTVLQGAVGFWGIFTDWLFAFAALGLYLVRLARGTFSRRPLVFLGRSVLFWAPIGLGVFLFVVQLHHVGALDKVLWRFIHQSGMDGGGLAALHEKPMQVTLAPWYTFSLANRYWKTFIPAAYGIAGEIIILSSAVGLVLLLAGFLVQRARGVTPSKTYALSVSVLFLILMPCLAYTYVFQTHSSYWLHFFGVLKFAPMIAIAPFVLWPAMLLRRLAPESNTGSRGFQIVSVGVAAALLLLAAGYVYALRDRREGMYAEPRLDNERIGAFLANHTRFEDVVFATNHKVQRHYVCYALKQMHRIRSILDVFAVVRDIEGDYVVNLFTKGDRDYRGGFGLPETAAMAFEEHHEKDLHLHKIHKKDFLALYRKLEPKIPATVQPIEGRASKQPKGRHAGN